MLPKETKFSTKKHKIKSIQNISPSNLLYSSEIWTLIQCDKNKLQTVDMKYLWLTARYTLLDHKINEEILEELHATFLEEKLCTNRHNWFQHVHRMEDYRLPKQLLKYHPKVRLRPA
jgi:hypothetical protein